MFEHAKQGAMVLAVSLAPLAALVMEAAPRIRW
jgi:hypothetical protein